MGNLLITTAILAAGAYGVYLLRTAKAAQSLRYQLQKIQIYKLASGGSITFRVWMSFTNLEGKDLTVNQMYLDVFLDFNGTRHRIATLNTDNTPIIIPANSTVERYFDITVPWANLGVATAAILIGLIQNGSANWPSQAQVEGQIKAAGFTIPVNITVPFSADALTNNNA